MGSQYRTLVWQTEPDKGEEIKKSKRVYWKVRRPTIIRTKEGTIDEKKEWKKTWRTMDKDKELGERVAEWADKIWEKGEYHPGVKRWWTKELTEARKKYGREKKTKENRKIWIKKI
jgi:hypothetical protein